MADDEVPTDEEAEEELLLPLRTLEDVKQALRKFLDANPASTLSTLEIPKVGKIHRLEKPWGDPTLVLLLPEDPAKTISILNSLFLPERLSALWHQDTKDIEVIWTALPLSPDQQEIAGRKFTFRFGSKNYKCEFGDASDRLLGLSGLFAPVTNPSDTQFRNLLSFIRMAQQPHNEQDKTEYHARSFWIRKVGLDMAGAIRMIECLNFYLTYYDARSPSVLIHDIHDPVAPQHRYREGKFPEKITGRNFDENLMSFWDATHQRNTMLRFIFFYRIIEYAASHYVDASVRAKLSKVVSDPAISENVDRAIESILSAFDGSKAEDVNRFNRLIMSSVDPSVVWREIETNKEMFSKKLKFDGGFVLTPILSDKESATTFASGGLVKFANAVRQIRNVLVHGRDQNTATAITPTPRNMKLLSAWVNAIAAAAGEVVVYGSNT